MTANSYTAFHAACPRCGFEATGGSHEDVAFIVSKHGEHTGHEMEWEQTDFDKAVSKREIYALQCDECNESWKFKSVFELEQFRNEHENYTDHKLAKEPVVETVDAVSITHLTHSLNNIDTILSILDAENSVGVRKSTLFELFEEETPDSIEEKLKELMLSGEAYEPKKGYIKIVDPSLR